MHKDERGIIEDLKVGKDWSVTYISFKKGAVRGNHYHKQTVQTDTALSGNFIVKTAIGGIIEVMELRPGMSITHHANIKHAYIATEDSEMISVCKGIRIGENYEEDTFRLEKPLI
jgi:quercetin dioxygenase-like cupin family protein